MYEKLRKKSSKVHLVVEQEDKKNHHFFTHEEIKIALDKMLCSYWFVLHDNDIDIDGMNKHNHYHIIMQFHSPKMLETILVNLCYHLGCDRKIVSINICSDLLENIRYLTHIDYPEKVQYDKEDVITNDKGVFDEAIIYITSLTTSMLIDIVNNNDTMTGILKTLGLTNFKKYTNIINTLWKEKYSNANSTYLEVKKAKQKLIENICETLRLYGLENKCSQFMEIISSDIIKRLGDY